MRSQGKKHRLIRKRVENWVDGGWMDGWWVGGWMDRWMDGWIDGGWIDA